MQTLVMDDLVVRRALRPIAIEACYILALIQSDQVETHFQAIVRDRDEIPMAADITTEIRAIVIPMALQALI